MLYTNISPYVSSKNVYTKAPVSILVIKFFSTHNHNTRYSAENKINIPLSNKSVCHNQYFYNAIKFWNEIPLDLKLTLNIIMENIESS